MLIWGGERWLRKEEKMKWEMKREKREGSSADLRRKERAKKREDEEEDEEREGWVFELQ